LHATFDAREIEQPGARYDPRASKEMTLGSTLTSRTESEAYFQCLGFLNREAQMLDDNQIRMWFRDMIDPEIDYRVPIRVTRSRTEGAGFSFAGWHMLDDYSSLEARVARLETEYAWAEDPPSRTRRLVTNVRVVSGESVDEVTSNLLVYRSRYDAATFNLLVGERHDKLRRTDDGHRLLKRMVLLDQTTVGTHNLAIFL
jgi:3-phenylpropionate/cinnamic acid dioxygenase small subunit